MRIESSLGSVYGVSRNISEGGMFVVAPLLPLGTELEIRIQTRPALQLRAKVQHQYAYDEGTGMGLAFCRMDAAQRGRLRQWLLEASGAGASMPL